MTDAETLALMKPHLTAAFAAGQKKGYAAALAESQSPVRTFAADSADEPEAERKPLAFYAAGGFTPEDVERYADYFAADDGGAYPGDLHRHFSLPVRAFADTTKLLRKQVRFSDGKSGWQWVPRVAANAAANAFSEDEQGHEHAKDGKFAPKGGGGEKAGEENDSNIDNPLHQMTEEQAVAAAPEQPKATPENLWNIADALRVALDEAVGDPTDQCIACAYALKKYYPEAQVFSGEVRHGEYGAAHTLAKIAGHFIDVTADQFGEHDTVQVIPENEFRRMDFYRLYKAPDPEEFGKQKQWDTQDAIERALGPALKRESEAVARWDHKEAVKAASAKKKTFSDDPDTVFSEDFASFADRKDGDVWETNGRHYKREAGVTRRLRNPNAEEKDKAKREKSEAYKKTSGGLTPKEVLVKQKEQAEPKREEARAAWASAVAHPNTVGAKEAPKLAEQLHTLTRDEARELLRAAQEKVGGLKAELVQRMLAKLGVPTDEQRRATLEQRIAEQGLTGDAANAMRRAAGLEEVKPEVAAGGPQVAEPAAAKQVVGAGVKPVALEPIAAPEVAKPAEPQPSTQPQPVTAPQAASKPARAPKAPAVPEQATTAPKGSAGDTLLALRNRHSDPTLTAKQLVDQTDRAIAGMSNQEVRAALLAMGVSEQGAKDTAANRAKLKTVVTAGRTAKERANDNDDFEAGWTVPQAAAGVRAGEQTPEQAQQRVARSLSQPGVERALVSAAKELGIDGADDLAAAVAAGKHNGTKGSALRDRVAAATARAMLVAELGADSQKTAVPKSHTSVPKVTPPPAVGALAKKPLADKQHLSQLAAAAPDQTTRDYLENAAHNAPGDKGTIDPADRRHQTVERLAAEHRNALAAGHTDAAGHLAKVIGEYGGKLEGAAPGETTPFDGSLYDSAERPGEGTLWTGQPARVMRQPILGPDGRVAVRGEMEPAGTAATPVAAPSTARVEQPSGATADKPAESKPALKPKPAPKPKVAAKAEVQKPPEAAKKTVEPEPPAKSAKTTVPAGVKAVHTYDDGAAVVGRSKDGDLNTYFPPGREKELADKHADAIADAVSLWVGAGDGIAPVPDVVHEIMQNTGLNKGDALAALSGFAKGRGASLGGMVEGKAAHALDQGKNRTEDGAAISTLHDKGEKPNLEGAYLWQNGKPQPFVQFAGKGTSKSELLAQYRESSPAEPTKDKK